MMVAKTSKNGQSRSMWQRFKNLFRRRNSINDMSEERQSALQARYAAEARRDDHQMTVRTHEPMF